MEAFVAGVIAGYGIAIPVGAIAVLIVEVGIRCGFRCAFFAGAGAATADLLYAGLAVIGGAALAGSVQAIDQPLRVFSAIVLILIAIYGLRRASTREDASGAAMPDTRELVRTYTRFVGLTLINPTTIVYFAAIIVGLGVADEMTAAQGILFSLGAFMASLSWQTLLAAIGGVAGDQLSASAQTGAVIVGNLVIVAFALVILFR